MEERTVEESTVELGRAILLRHQAVYQVRMEMAERAWGSATYAATVEFVNALQRRWSPVADGAAEDSMVQRLTGTPAQKAAPRVVEGERVLPTGPVGGGLGEAAVAVREDALTPTGEATAAGGAPIHEVVGVGEVRDQLLDHILEPGQAQPGEQGPVSGASPRAGNAGGSSAPLPVARGDVSRGTIEKLLALLRDRVHVGGATPMEAAVGEHPAAGTAIASTGAPPAATPAQSAVAPTHLHTPPPPEWSAEIPGHGNAPLTWADRRALLHAGLAPQPAQVQDAAAGVPTRVVETPPAGQARAEGGVPVSPSPAVSSGSPASVAPLHGTPSHPPVGVAHTPPPPEWSAEIPGHGNVPLTWADRRALLHAGLAPQPAPVQDAAAGVPTRGVETPPAGQARAEGGVAVSASPAVSPGSPHGSPASVAPAHGTPTHPPAGVAHTPPPPEWSAEIPGHGNAPLTWADRRALLRAGVAPQPESAAPPAAAPSGSTPPAAGSDHTATKRAAMEVVASEQVDPKRPWDGSAIGPGQAPAHPSIASPANAGPLAPPATSDTTSPVRPSLVYREPPAPVPAPVGHGSSGAAAMSMTEAAQQNNTAQPRSAAGLPAGVVAPHLDVPARDQQRLADEVSAQMLRRFAREMALEAERRGVVAWDY